MKLTKKAQKELRRLGYNLEFNFEPLWDFLRPEFESLVKNREGDIGVSIVIQGKRFYFYSKSPLEAVAQAVIHKLHELRS